MQKVRLKKNVGVIHHVTVGKPLNLLAKKLFNILLFKAHRNLLDQERHEVTVHEMVDLLGFNSNNTGTLKDALRDLVDVRIEWNAIGDAGESEWIATSALAEAKIANGVCTYAYAPTLRDKLANPEVWALIDLHLQSRFTKTHTWSLYENVARYRGVGRTPEFELSLLSGLLGLSDSKTYREFKYLNRDVINPALDEINTKSDIEVTMLPPRRMRRKVVAVQFEVKERKSHASVNERSAALARLKKFGVEGRDAEMALRKHPDEKLMAILDDIERRLKAKEVKNVRPYTVTVLRESDGDIVPALQREHDAKERAKQEQKSANEFAEERRRKLQREFDAWKAERVAEEERSLTEEDAARLHQEFVEYLRAEAPFAYDVYSKGGEKKSLVQHQLLEFKVKKLLGPEDRNYEKWLEDQEEAAVTP